MQPVLRRVAQKHRSIRTVEGNDDFVAALPSAHTVTFRIGGRRYEMTWHSEVREITKGPAKIIEMPGRSASKP